MQIIRTAEAFARLLATHPDPDLRALLRAQADRLADYDLEELALFIVVEPGDTPDTLNAALGRSLLDADTFAHPVELIDRAGGWYEVTFILDDTGFGLVLYVSEGQLLVACEREYVR